MLAVLRQRNFALLAGAWFVSQAGDMVLLAALPYYVYQETGSALATGATFVAETVPVLLLGSISGVFVDRWDRRRTVAIGALLQAACVLLLLVVGATGWIWVVYVSAFVEKGIAQFTGPAGGALLPRVVAEEDLVAANSVVGTASSVVMVIGPALGGAAMALLGLPAVVLLDSASFLLAAILVARLVLPPEPVTRPAARPPTVGGAWIEVWREWLAGLRLIRGDRLLAGFFAFLAVAALAQGLVAVLLVVFVREVLGGEAAQFGWLISAQGAGGVAGGFVAGKAAERLGLVRLIALGTGGTGLLLLVMTNAAVWAVVLPAVAAIGVLQVWSTIGQRTLLQTWVADAFRGRVFGTTIFVWAVLTLVGMGAGSLLGDSLGAVPIFSVAATLFVVAGAVALMTLPDWAAEPAAAAG
jgi:MFS family permease